MPSWFYLSFADAARPEGDQFLGGAYVKADDLVEAVRRAHRLGINPGGEVQSVGPLPQEAVDANVPVDQRERLLSRAEIEGVPDA